jgi:hypothetical protein
MEEFWGRIAGRQGRMTWKKSTGRQGRMTWKKSTGRQGRSGVSPPSNAGGLQVFGGITAQ